MFGGAGNRANFGTPGAVGEVTSRPTSSFIAQTTGGQVGTARPQPLPGVPGISFTPGRPQFFGSVPGAMLPGTLPSNYNPIGMYRGPLATDLIMQNPNLSPTILGGLQGLGYYTDRLGNRIFSPGGAFLRFNEGGEAKKEDLEEDGESAQAALRRLLAAAPEQTQTEVSVSPNARSVKKTTRKSVESGLGKGISMKMEEARMSSEPTSREQLAAMGEQYKDLLRNTLGKPTLTARGPLAARRFAEGGEATVQPTGRYYGGFTPDSITGPTDHQRRFGYGGKPNLRDIASNRPEATRDQLEFVKNLYKSTLEQGEAPEEFQDAVARRTVARYYRPGLMAPSGNPRPDLDSVAAMALGNQYQNYLNNMINPPRGGGIVRDERLGDDSLSMNVPGFQEGGEAKKKKPVLPPDRSRGFREEGIGLNPQAVPAAQVRTYLNTLFGETRPITERDFTEAELRLALEAMKKAKESGRESTVDYRDYGIPLTPFADVHPFEEASIRNTLGTWNYETKDDTLRGKDRYDFDRDLGGRSSADYAKMSLPKKLGVLALDTVNFLPLLKDMYNVVRLKPMTGEGMAYGPLTLPHRIGAAFMPPEGREVDINFGSQAAKELEAVAPKKKKKR